MRPSRKQCILQAPGAPPTYTAMRYARGGGGTTNQLTGTKHVHWLKSAHARETCAVGFSTKPRCGEAGVG